MQVVRKGILGVVLAAFVAAPVLAQQNPVQAPAPQDCTETALYCPATSTAELALLLADYPEPAVAAPSSMFATPDFTVKRTIAQTVKYQIAVTGSVQTNLDDFKRQVQETLNDDRGWKRLGVQFEYTQSGGAFTVVLAEASLVPSFGPPCDSVWNCNVGNNVVINQDRWLLATDPWNAAGGTIRNYRHMAINHELGHWLGHDHAGCSGAGQAAPVMMQQSMDLKGCKFNPWPLDSEVTSARLGV